VPAVVAERAGRTVGLAVTLAVVASRSRRREDAPRRRGLELRSADFTGRRDEFCGLTMLG